ncbi:MAG TPA: S41 family peptidase [Flavobacterium sp.]|jgi:hypothetical protein
MKILSSVFCLFFVTISFAQKNGTHFKTEIDFGNGTVFSTFLDVSMDEDQFTITSPENADVRLFGGKAKLGRLLGKSPKKGIIVTIKGKQKKDSLFGETNIPMVGKLKFKGIVKNKTLSGEFISAETTSIGTLHGVVTEEEKLTYSHLYPIIVKTIQDNIYSKDAIENEDWKDFQEKIKKLCTTAHDDIELFLGFNIYNQELPFTHLNLFIGQIGDAADSVEKRSTQKSVIFEEKNTTTAYLLIKNFSSSAEELATILPKIVQNQNYQNLIVDLRNNPGGGIDAAFEFARHITDNDINVGFFVTNKLRYSGFEPALFNTLPELQPESTQSFTDELQTLPGVKLIFKKPENRVFTGKLFVLTNGGTGSTSEPIVYSLKNSKRAVIIGEKTAGAMLAATPFNVSGKYNIMLPIADFYTYDGVRLDKVGVRPNIEVNSEDALKKALELINNAK